MANYLKSELSRVWRMFKYRRRAKHLNAAFLQQLEGLGEVDISEIRQLFTRLKPRKCKAPMIRVGSDYDGGYLLADDFENLVGSFSPGVSDTMDFDIELANRGIPCFLADASIDRLVMDHPLFDFEKVFLGAKTLGNSMTIEDWLGRKAPTKGDLLLQMDIEGAEYEVLAHCSADTLYRFRQIIIEVHDSDMVASREGFVRFSSFLDRLLENHTIIHIHHNNSLPLADVNGFEFSRVFELTLLRNDKFQEEDTQSAPIPHPLDMPCVFKLPDIPIPKTW